MKYELAQLNIAEMQFDMDDERMKDFVDNLDRINGLAESSDGFLWRLQDEDGNATSFRPFGDNYLVNLSVWRDLDALRRFVFESAHVEIMRRRKEWFERMGEAYVVLWWIPAGERPTEAQAGERLDMIRREGPTPEAFNFQKNFPAPNG